jgi:hypothetical protein
MGNMSWSKCWLIAQRRAACFDGKDITHDWVETMAIGMGYIPPIEMRFVIADLHW